MRDYIKIVKSEKHGVILQLFEYGGYGCCPVCKSSRNADLFGYTEHDGYRHDYFECEACEVTYTYILEDIAEDEERPAWTTYMLTLNIEES